MSKEIIKVPDIGGAEDVEVIEVCVAPGDSIAAEDSMVVLESDKASMEVPAPKAGTVIAVRLNEGDTVSEGDVILELELATAEAAATETQESEAAVAEPATDKEADTAAQPEPASAAAGGVSRVDIPVPDIGGSEAVDVIEVCVEAGERVAAGDSLIVLESDKASMEIPSPSAGLVIELKVKEGAKVSQGDLIAVMEVEIQEAAPKAEQAPAAKPAPGDTAPVKAPVATAPVKSVPTSIAESKPTADVYAGPAVRQLARELGVDLAKVKGSGPRGRIQKDDLHAYVKTALQTGTGVAGGSGIPPVPDADYAQFGDVSVEKLSKLHKITAENMHRSWLNVPHVTQFDDVDITDLEAFRQSLKVEGEQRGVKVTPLAFLMKACAKTLLNHPKFNVSLLSDGEHIVYKKYVHIGMAVDTPAGLVVPVVRDVDKKSLFDIAAETAELAAKAKERKLKPDEMKGGCFTISSLGSIGGRGFTPVVNTPEVAILGVSKLEIKPLWNGKEFEPRKMLPLSLSYDHRAVNGADAGRFMTELGQLLADIRRIML